jgi:hypothetical protein
MPVVGGMDAGGVLVSDHCEVLVVGVALTDGTSVVLAVADVICLGTGVYV